ncbi:MAG: hypothetical protein J6Q69_03745 [Clostridia bacterium]|nr:hypothetical protein [Clostridia bacterium]
MEFVKTLIPILFGIIILLHFATSLLPRFFRHISAYTALLAHLVLLCCQLIVAEPLINVAITIMLLVLVYCIADFVAVKWVRPIFYKNEEGGNKK